MYTKYLTFILVSLVFLLNGCDATSTTTNDKNKILEVPKEHTTSESSTHTTTSNNTHAALKQIDVLVIVDSNEVGTQNGSTYTKIDHFMSVTNKIFQNSTVPAKLNVVKIQPYSFKPKNSKDALSEIYHSKSIAAVRNASHADIVVIYRNNANDGVCGIAYLNKALDKNIGYAHVSLRCPSTTTAHEVGHTMGLAHSTKKTSKHGHLAYGHGYGITGEFSTIMSYKSTYSTSVRVFNYSSPDIECQGYECGDESANSVKALQNSINRVVSFR